MAYRFAKGLVAGCALSTAIAAVGYTQINSFLPLTPQAPTAVSAEHQVPAVNSVEVSAFIANTQLMAQPAVASGRDIARAQVLTVALTEDFLPTCLDRWYPTWCRALPVNPVLSKLPPMNR
jgi:hypothetical protein